jgi:hypothetical protein
MLLLRTGMEADELLPWIKRRIEVAGLAGYAKAEIVAEALPDALAVEDVDVDAPEGRALLADLESHLRSTWARASQIEAAWTERTPTDRLDDAVDDLRRQGTTLAKVVGCSQEDDFFDQGWWDLGIDGVHTAALNVTVAYDGVELSAVATIPWSKSLRREEFQQIVDAVVHVFSHHGLRAAFDEKAEAIVVESFPFQKRRSTSAPGQPVAAPPRAKPAVCTLCSGKGWTQSSPSAFPEMCVCKKDA